MRDRAVMLAQLHARTRLAHLRRVAAGGEHVGEHVGPCVGAFGRRDLRLAALAQQLLDPVRGEILHRGGPGVLGEVAQRGDGEVVVAVAEARPARRR